MGNLKSLSDVRKNSHLLLTSSNLAEIFVYDTLKKRCKATLESVVDVNSSSTYKAMLELVNLQPTLADCWLFVVDYSKVKSLLKKNLGIFQSDSSVFLVKVKNYKEYKEALSLGVVFNDLYLEVIKKLDVYDLLREFKISQKVKDFIALSYYKDPDKVFTLVNELKNGALIEDQKDVIKLCGESTSSIQRFVIQLLADEPKTKRFLSRSFKKRASALCELCDTFGSRTAYNYIRSSVRDVLAIKVLFLEGAIYDRVYNLPECYDEKKLSRYNYYLKTISEDISYSRILMLYKELSGYSRWVSSTDGVLFLYNYYLKLLDGKL